MSSRSRQNSGANMIIERNWRTKTTSTIGIDEPTVRSSTAIIEKVTNADTISREATRLAGIPETALPARSAAICKVRPGLT